ncbi:MAG: alpha-L-fucosidase [Planctomycetota bacterium]|jgi:alpha-L-fucosidase
MRMLSLLALTLVTLAAACQALVAVEHPVYVKNERTEWFEEGRFGMFIHWGLYAIPAGVWQGEPIKKPYAEWIMNRFGIPVAEYEQLAAQFNPTQFDPEHFADVMAKAGMTYVVITAKHHDGFAMFESEVSAYNVVDATPYGRNIVKDLFAACRKRGIRTGVYYSHRVDWHELNQWDESVPSERDVAAFDAYIANKSLPQVEELLTTLGQIDVMWFDVPGPLSRAHAESFRDMVRKHQPDCLITSRLIDRAAVEHADLFDYASLGDNALITSLQPYPWEYCMTMGHSWGHSLVDHAFSPVELFVERLATSTSYGGNLLLNIGPTKEGLIDTPQAERLEGIGEWMSVYKDTIHHTSGTPFNRYFHQAAFTQKPGKVFIHLFNRGEGKELVLPGVRSAVTGLTHYVDGSAVPFERRGDDIVFTVPENPAVMHDVLVLSHEDDSLQVEPIQIHQAADGSIHLPCELAYVTGGKGSVRHGMTKYHDHPVIEMRRSHSGDCAEWTLEVSEAGTFAVASAFSGNASSATFEIAVNGVVTSTTQVEGDARFATPIALDPIALPAGTVTLRLERTGDARGLYYFKDILLTRQP